MLALNAEDGQTPGQLATRLGVRPPTITKTINRLQAQGFLEKRPSETDARQAHIFMTETGRDAIRAIEKSVRKTEKQAMKGLDKKDLKQMTKLLQRIEANLSNTHYADSDDEAEALDGIEKVDSMVPAAVEPVAAEHEDDDAPKAAAE